MIDEIDDDDDDDDDDDGFGVRVRVRVRLQSTGGYTSTNRHAAKDIQCSMVILTATRLIIRQWLLQLGVSINGGTPKMDGL